jgi:hypothetical protein
VEFRIGSFGDPILNAAAFRGAGGNGRFASRARHVRAPLRDRILSGFREQHRHHPIDRLIPAEIRSSMSRAGN